jgi:2-polyprenyl-6-methoxyphenol hydroxylase-like FAD-dependent oxidoreductase
MSTIKHALIIGGGVGGLTAAVALKRKGITAEVIEKDPEWGVYGVGIIQPTNFLRGLCDVGLGQACIENGRAFKGWEYYDTEDNVLAQLPGVNVADEGFPPVNGIRRPELHKILSEAVLGQGTNVRLGVTVSSWEENNEGIDVTFSDGSKGSYDIVIAADGALSETRTALFGELGKPWFTGQGVWRYNFDRPKDMEWGAIIPGKKSKAGLVPLSETTMYMFLVTGEPGNPRMDRDKLHELLRERMAEYTTGILARLREQVIDPKEVVYRPMEVCALPAPWHKGRIILIGDACHSGTPHLAEGAAMAVEDAVLLATMLSEPTTDLETTLTAFTERRLPRTNLVYNTGIKLGEWELAEWNGTPDPEADPKALLTSAYDTLWEPI